MKSILSAYTYNSRDQAAWNKLVRHPLQSWEWGEFREKSGIRTVRLGIKQDSKTIAGWQIFFHRIPHTGKTIGYFPKGPMYDRYMISVLNDLGRQYHAVFIQLEPDVIKNQEQIPKIDNLLPSHHPLFTKYTYVLDLDKPEEVLLKQLHPKTRYNIRLAQRHGVVIRQDDGPQALENYLRLTDETTRRQKFFAHTPAYHQRMWKIMHEGNIAHLWTASYRGEIIATWVIFCFGDKIYYPYGASSDQARPVMASNLLAWDIILWAKKNGFKKFDMWGALGPDPDPRDPWFGFHRFKSGYAPDLVEHIGSFDLLISPVWYVFYKQADRLRWNLLRLAKRMLPN